MAFEAVKFFCPIIPPLTRTWRGPFGGAKLVLNPHDSVRKIGGLYEHVLNDCRSCRRVK